MTKDYSLTLQDSTGRTVILHINGAAIDELRACGDAHAEESAERNAFQNAIAAGQIGEDAYLI